MTDIICVMPVYAHEKYTNTVYIDHLTGGYGLKRYPADINESRMKIRGVTSSIWIIGLSNLIRGRMGTRQCGSPNTLRLHEVLLKWSYIRDGVRVI